MTDGENSSSSDNTKTLTQCKRAKDAGVTVYTVGFMLSSLVAKNFMLNCASSAATYYDAQDGSLLNAAFATSRHRPQADFHYSRNSAVVGDEEPSDHEGLMSQAVLNSFQ
jgi:hypothetical protein